MNKIKTTALSVSMILIMIGMMMIPAAMGSTGTPSNFTITVNSGQSTSLLSTDTTFGSVLAGSTHNITPSFNLTNVGNVDAKVNATFTTYNGSTYGLYSTSGAIGGANFSMKLSTAGTYVALDNLVTSTFIGASHNVVADAVADDWDVQLIIPAGQAAATYTGTVQLTFTDA